MDGRSLAELGAIPPYSGASLADLGRIPPRPEHMPLSSLGASAFDVAAQRTRNSVLPPMGRREGMLSSLPEDLLIPKTPLDAGLMLAGGPIGRAFKLAAVAGGAALTGSDAEASPFAVFRKGIKAYHGSPHDFDKFDLSKIGTGEGAQAYGHGLYFAENEGVARSYKLAGKTRPSSLWYEGGNIQNIPRDQYMAMPKLTRESLGFARDEANLAEAVQNATARGRVDIADEIMRLQQSGKLSASAPPPGRMYEVNINAKPEQFLDWDKPLKDQPVAETMRGLVKPDLRKTFDFNTGRGISGSNAYYNFYGSGKGGLATASQTLKEAGIPGVKYLDQGSRGAAQGTSNYVLFDDKIIDILKKYGLPGAVGAGGFGSLATQDQQ